MHDYDREPVRKGPVNLQDYELFLSVMKNRRAFEIVIDTILGESIKLSEVKVEEVILNEKKKRAIRLDAWALAEDHRQFAVEMEKHRKDDIRKRSRYYQGLLDTPILKSGKKTKYRDLPPTIIVFITREDIFGRDQAQYVFHEHCDEDPSLLLQDETTKIFLNMSSKNGRKELISMLQYMRDTRLDNPDIPIITDNLREFDAIVAETKESEEWEEIDMSLAERYKEGWKEIGLAEGRAIGIEEGRAKGIAEGRAEGRAEGKIEGRNEKIGEMLLRHSPEEIADFCGYSLDEVLAVKKLQSF